MTVRGWFVVLEGPEAAGKSTLLRGLAQRMRDDDVDPLIVREPGGTPVAEVLRHELLDAARAWTPERELLFLVTARADLVSTVIEPALMAGRTVLADRFDLSTLAYQGAGRQLPIEQVRWINAAATGGLRPDLTLVLDVEAAEARARQQRAGKGLDRFEREPADFHARVAAAYRDASGIGVHHLSGGASSDGVLTQAWDIIVRARPAVFRPRQALTAVRGSNS